MLAMVGNAIHSRRRWMDDSWSALIAETTLSRPGSPGFAGAPEDIIKASAVAASAMQFSFILIPFRSNPCGRLERYLVLVQSEGMRYFLDTEFNGFGGALLSL